MTIQEKDSQIWERLSQNPWDTRTFPNNNINIIAESVNHKLNEMDWSTKYNAGRKEQDLFEKFTQGERNFTEKEQKRLKRRVKELGGLDYGYENNKKSPFLDSAETDF